ncbi:hypothetical protein DW322_19740 [Rhodococcus rhodnii]|uniref:AbiEi antitoxin N-terminal domain-containing protein n=2 Tax=Rhodococcus rhodnii TaxID=38312 RepID=R7WMZ8_9NOCA|nr:type IV toxin-antitoxin system AbiEi family antitoxin domain-containing protein [Rhodococcus rhodnii]EOM76670.1 hypothetical protein Rrhod_1947 [Rhodococcus rhodnii LMG 5362]TXG91999.1 hypothetical protein DW322_19740 [Rhodococcus rhodnii]
MTDSHDESRGDADTRAALVRVAADQAGFFTTAQALDAGYASTDLGDRILDGTWRRIDRDLYRLAGHPTSDLDEYAKWCAWFGGGAVVSHQSAAELYGLGHLYPRFIHLSTVLTPPSPTTALALHRRALAPEECQRLGGIRLTTPVRTVLDLAGGGISQELLDEVVGDGVAIARFRPDELQAAVATGAADVARRIEHALAACT